MYDIVTQTESTAMTSGSPTSEPMASFASARTIEHAPAAAPTRAMNRNAAGFCRREPSTYVSCASAVPILGRSSPTKVAFRRDGSLSARRP